MAAGLSYFSGFDALSAPMKERIMLEALPQHLSQPTTHSEAARVAVVCVHGFTAMPYEVMPIANACHEKGVGAIAPLLPGHGYKNISEQKQQFGTVTKDNLLGSVRTEIARARQQYDKVGIYGHSMGGAIALILAAEGLVDACAVTAPAIKLPLIADLLAPVVCCIGFTRNVQTCESFEMPFYRFHHSHAVRALWRLSRLAKRQLSQVNCPVLGVHTHQDTIVPPVVLDMMEQRIPGPLETQWFEPSCHLMTLDVSGQAISQSIATFFQKQLMPAPSALMPQSSE